MVGRRLRRDGQRPPRRLLRSSEMRKLEQAVAEGPVEALMRGKDREAAPGAGKGRIERADAAKTVTEIVPDLRVAGRDKCRAPQPADRPAGLARQIGDPEIELCGGECGLEGDGAAPGSRCRVGVAGRFLRLPEIHPGDGVRGIAPEDSPEERDGDCGVTLTERQERKGAGNGGAAGIEDEGSPQQPLGKIGPVASLGDLGESQGGIDVRGLCRDRPVKGGGTRAGGAEEEPPVRIIRTQDEVTQNVAPGDAGSGRHRTMFRARLRGAV